MDPTVAICSFVALAAISVLIAAWMHEARPRWQARSQMAQRRPLTDEQFGRQFFPPDQASAAALIRRLLAEGYDQDLSRLHPDDRFDLVLPLNQLDSLDTVEMLLTIESTLGIELPAESVSNITTFRDLMNVIQAQGPGCEKWRENLGRFIEERFGVSLSRAELLSTATPQMLTDLLTNKLQGQLQRMPTCQSQRSFYLLRNALIELRCGARGAIKPDTPLRTLIPRRRVRVLWPRLRDTVSARQWPSLVRPRWTTGLVTGIPILLGVAAGFGLPALSEWILEWRPLLGFVLAFLSDLRALAVPLLILVAWVVAVKVAGRWKIAFPRNLRTVRDLVPFLATSTEARWTKRQVAEQVRQILVEKLHVPPEKYCADACFVEDLGCDPAPFHVGRKTGPGPAEHLEALDSHNP